MTESFSPNSNQINLITWNILLDITRTKNKIVKPQHERVESQAKTLMELGVDLDVVMLQEVEGGNGKRIAELTSNDPGFWKQHKRQEEHIGVFGNRVEGAEFHKIGDNRRVVVTRVGGLAIFGLHLSARPKNWRIRLEEMERFCELIDQEEETAVVGDFNGLRWEPARRMLARRGFISAFAELGEKCPPTYPTEAYRDIMWTPRQQKVLRGPVAIDDILVRGTTVIDADRFEGDSDHFGLYADLAA